MHNDDSDRPPPRRPMPGYHWVLRPDGSTDPWNGSRWTQAPIPLPGATPVSQWPRGLHQLSRAEWDAHAAQSRAKLEGELPANRAATRAETEAAAQAAVQHAADLELAQWRAYVAENQGRVVDYLGRRIIFDPDVPGSRHVESGSGRSGGFS